MRPLSVKDVTAVVVTRGDVDLEPVVASLYKAKFNFVIVWDNSKEHDRGVYGRYLATHKSLSDLIYVQDDDCIVEHHEAFLTHWRPGVVVANMPAIHRPKYPDGIALVGFGALFDRQLKHHAFRRYLSCYPEDRLFDLECDRIFTAFNEVVRIDVPYRDLPQAHHKTRLWKQPDHLLRLAQIRDRINAIKTGRACA